MTAEILLILLIAAAAALAAASSALILAAFGHAGWFVLSALTVTGLLAARLVAVRLSAGAAWSREDLRDEWRAGGRTEDDLNAVSN